MIGWEASRRGDASC